MNTEKFTPGPWFVDGKVIDTNHSFEIAIISDYEENANGDWISESEQSANANLISAAPDMYEALKITYELLSVGQPLGNDDLDKINAALNKANPNK